MKSAGGKPNPRIERMDYSVVVACNDESVLRHSLLSSPDLDPARVLVERGYPSAASAYNAGLREASSELVVFVHQDIYLPGGWFNSLHRAIETVRTADPDWGVLGVFGITPSGQRVGYLYSTGLRGFVGESFSKPTAVDSLDEIVLVVRREAGLEFDEQLPGFHLYGTDICQQALCRDLHCYAVPAFCLHNSNGIAVLPPAYLKAFLYLRRKWRRRLPLHTSCSVITRSGIALLTYYVKTLLSLALRGKNVGKRCADPASVYHQLLSEGWLGKAAADLSSPE